MKILVLGSGGFVGKSVVECLRTTKHTIVEIPGKKHLDLRSYSAVEGFLKKNPPDVIINCASHGGSLHYVTEYAANVIDDNIQIFLNLYRAVAKVCPRAVIINPIANCSYPGSATLQKESEYWSGAVHQSVWSFGNSRRMLLVISQCYQMQYGIKSINLIMPNAYGLGDSADPNKTHALNGMIIRMVAAKKNNDAEFEIWGTGKPKREWMYVKDMATVLVKAAHTASAAVAPVNIAQNIAYSIKETAEMIKQETGYQGKLVFNKNYADGAPIKKMDNTLFKKTYPKFVFTDIKKGITATVNYYQNIV
jgi:GDP-L-fucose synthase